MINRVMAARVINVVTAIASLAIVWQIVRFCQGQIDMHDFYQFFTGSIQKYLLEPIFGNESVSKQWTYGDSILYYEVGIVAWAVLCSLVMALGNALARNVEVGFNMDSSAERQMLDSIDDASREKYLYQIECALPSLVEKFTVVWMFFGFLVSTYLYLSEGGVWLELLLCLPVVISPFVAIYFLALGKHRVDYVNKLLAAYEPLDKEALRELQSQIATYGWQSSFIQDWLRREKEVVKNSIYREEMREGRCIYSL